MATLRTCNPLLSFFLAVCLLSLSACNGPLMMLPGGKLKGAEAPLPAAGGEGGVMVLETRPAEPYSVTVGYVVIAGNYYVDPAPERTWLGHMLNDPQIRVRFEGSETIHPAQVERVTDSELRDRFESDRIVLRIVARS